MEVDAGPMDAGGYGDRIIELLKLEKYARGELISQLSRNTSGAELTQAHQNIALSINYLLQKRLMDLYQEQAATGQPELIVKLLDEETAERKRKLERELTREELTVYQIIEDSGNMGIWSREVRKKSGLVQNQMEKTVKSLMSKKLVKPVTSVQSANKKVYMLYDIEPARAVTGGAWYSGQEFDGEFIKVLREHCHQYIVDKGFARLDDVCKYIVSSNISQVELTRDEVAGLLDTLQLDGRLRLEGDLYQPSRNLDPINDLTVIPCARCPVSADCHDGGIVNPAACEYLTQWLNADKDELF